MPVFIKHHLSRGSVKLAHIYNSKKKLNWCQDVKLKSSSRRSSNVADLQVCSPDQQHRRHLGITCQKRKFWRHLRPTYGVRNPGGISQQSGLPSLPDDSDAHSSLKTTVFIDRFLSLDLSHFPNHSGWVAAPMLRKNESISILFTDAKPSPWKDTPRNLLPDSDDLLIFNAFHLAACWPLWDHMCRILRAWSQRSGRISVQFWVDWKAAAAIGKENQAAWAPCCFCLESKFPHTPHGSFQ